MRNRRLLSLAIIIPFVLALRPTQAASPTEQARVKVTPAVVEMGTFYGGAKVHVEGIAGPGDNVVLVVRGSRASEVFNKVGRVGPIWVNTGKVTISAVPSVLLVFSSAPVSACLNRAALDKYELDAVALKQQMRIETKVPEEGIAGDFLMLKAKRGTYRLAGGGIQTRTPSQEGLPYSLEFDLPRSVAPGMYQVNALECRNGEVAENSEVNLKVVEVGFPAVVVRLAMQRPAVYGVISVVIAMLAGFGIDFIAARLFKRKVAVH
jgi:uncharacterized protein (TIGR02186 family)